ncbi:MAG: alpha/beta hydrolase [Nanoarchaeota archaeon]|nr:alpha/beta hydrolase [Nanoarchaeota archaeon]
MEEKIIFKNSKGQTLIGILSNPTRNKKNLIVVFCHGLSSSKDRRTCVILQEKLNNLNISTFRFDFFGHGESGGKFEDITLTEGVDDILNAIKYLKNLGYVKFGLFGSSFGGNCAILAVSKTKDFVVLGLKCPVSNYIGKLIAQKSKEEIKNWKDKGYINYSRGFHRKLNLNYSFFEDSKVNDGWKSAKKIKIPTLVVHGDKDITVPIEQSKKLCGLINNCKLKIIKGCDHFFQEQEYFNKLIRLLVEWFKGYK